MCTQSVGTTDLLSVLPILEYFSGDIASLSRLRIGCSVYVFDQLNERNVMEMEESISHFDNFTKWLILLSTVALGCQLWSWSIGGCFGWKLFSASWLGQRWGISFLKASLKNLQLLSLLGWPDQCISPWHNTHAKALASSSLADDDYILSSFTSLEASSKRFLCRGIFQCLSLPGGIALETNQTSLCHGYLALLQPSFWWLCTSSN